MRVRTTCYAIKRIRQKKNTMTWILTQSIGPTTELLTERDEYKLKGVESLLESIYCGLSESQKIM